MSLGSLSSIQSYSINASLTNQKSHLLGSYAKKVDVPSSSTTISFLNLCEDIFAKTFDFLRPKDVIQLNTALAINQKIVAGNYATGKNKLEGDWNISHFSREIFKFHALVLIKRPPVVWQGVTSLIIYPEQQYFSLFEKAMLEDFFPYIKSIDIRCCTQKQLNFIAKYCPELEKLKAKSSEFETIPESLKLSIREINVSNNKKIIELDLPNATRIDCVGCFSLKRLNAPSTIEIDCSGILLDVKDLNLSSSKEISCFDCTQERLEIIAQKCPQLEILITSKCTFSEIPESLMLSLKKIKIRDNPNNIQVDLPRAEEIELYNCSHLSILLAPKVHRVVSVGNPLLNIKVGFLISLRDFTIEYLTQQDIGVVAEHCSNLENLEAKKSSFSKLPESLGILLKKINIDGNPNIKALNLPNATKVICCNCGALERLDALKAVTIDCAYSYALKILNAPQAKEIDCDSEDDLCTVSSEVSADSDYEEVYRQNWYAPNATYVNSRECKYIPGFTEHVSL